MIQEQVILEAKKLIHLSLKSIKEIAAELDFDDEHYFSRYFKTVQKNIDWHQENGTYIFSYALGTVIVLIGLFTLSGIWKSATGMAGGLLTFGMWIVTLSFLITTPEVYVPDLGGDFPTPHHGFPYLWGQVDWCLKALL